MTPVQFVLDCSVVLAWYFPDEANSYADAVARQLSTIDAIVPSLWPLEVANGILMGERRKRSTIEQSTRWLAFLESLPITIDGEPAANALRETLTIARTHGLSAYDAAYLELAIRRRLPIATLDRRLRIAAAGSGVALHRAED